MSAPQNQQTSTSDYLATALFMSLWSKIQLSNISTWMSITWSHVYHYWYQQNYIFMPFTLLHPKSPSPSFLEQVQYTSIQWSSVDAILGCVRLQEHFLQWLQGGICRDLNRKLLLPPDNIMFKHFQNSAIKWARVFEQSRDKEMCTWLYSIYHPWNSNMCMASHFSRFWCSKSVYFHLGLGEIKEKLHCVHKEHESLVFSVENVHLYPVQNTCILSNNLLH